MQRQSAVDTGNVPTGGRSAYGSDHASGPDTGQIDLSKIAGAAPAPAARNAEPAPTVGWTTSAGWVGLVHTRRGRRSDRPNQDAAIISPITLPNATSAAVPAAVPPAMAELPGGLIAAVADGHGADRHVRSDLGARMAVELAVHLLLERGTQLVDIMVPLVDRWRGEVRRHAALTPFTRAEKAAAATTGVRLDDDPVTAYGSTLLIAVVQDDSVQLAQLGDGDALVLGPDGPARLAAPETAASTSSLCLPTAITDLRVATLAGARMVLLATDGVGDAENAADPWFRSLVEYEQLAAQGLDHLAEELGRRLAAAAEAGGDATVAVLVRH